MDFELPITAFQLNGYGEYICLTITDVFGFPNRTSYGGGYSVKGNIKILVGGYSVNSQHYFTTGELYKFYNDLSYCYNNLTGIAELPNTEQELTLLTLSVIFNKTGHVSIKGSYHENLRFKK